MFAKRMVQIILILALLVASFAFARPAAAAPGPCGRTYVVQPGDWLAKIAERCGVSLAALYAANPWLHRYYYIYSGQVLTIPGDWEPYNMQPPADPDPYIVQPHDNWTPYSMQPPDNAVQGCGPRYSESYGHYYVVCRGDSLGWIARYYGLDVSVIQWHNHIGDGDLIYAGQIIWP